MRSPPSMNCQLKHDQACGGYHDLSVANHDEKQNVKTACREGDENEKGSIQHMDRERERERKKDSEKKVKNLTMGKSP